MVICEGMNFELKVTIPYYNEARRPDVFFDPIRPNLDLNLREDQIMILYVRTYDIHYSFSIN